MAKQLNVIEIYGNNAAVLCPGCPAIFLTSSITNKKNGRKCPQCGQWIAKLEQGNKTVTFLSIKAEVPAI